MEQICTRKKVFKQLNVFSLPLIFNQFNIIITTLLATIIGRISMNAIASTEVVDNFLYCLIC